MHTAGDATATERSAFPMAEARPGARLRIASARGPRLQRRLQELGLPRGALVTVLHRLGRRNAALVVDAHGARLAIGAAMARDIQVVDAPAVP